MQTYDTATRNIKDAETLDYYISNAIAKGTNIEQNIRIMEEAINQHALKHLDAEVPLITTKRKTQSRGGMST